MARASPEKRAAEHVALAWARHQPYASRVCVATTSVARLADDARALSLPLSPSDLAWLESGDPALLPARLRSRDRPPSRARPRPSGRC